MKQSRRSGGNGIKTGPAKKRKDGEGGDETSKKHDLDFEDSIKPNELAQAFESNSCSLVFIQFCNFFI